MKTHPPTPSISDAPDSLFESGHLWLFEWIDGEPLRFSVHEAGFLQFGDGTRVYNEPDDLPPQYQPAVSSLQARLDRETLHEAVEDVSSLVFFGQSTHHQTITYDWQRLPPFIGYDIWDGERYLGPASATQAFEKLGLEPATTLEREVRARDFDLEDIELPGSAWYDGPAAGVLIRNKQDDRALHYDPPALDPAEVTQREEETEKIIDGEDSACEDTVSGESTSGDTASENTVGGQLASLYADIERFERVVATLEQRGEPITFDTVFECVLELLARETYGHLDAAGISVTDGTFRERVAERTREWIAEGEQGATD